MQRDSATEAGEGGEEGGRMSRLRYTRYILGVFLILAVLFGLIGQGAEPGFDIVVTDIEFELFSGAPRGGREIPEDAAVIGDRLKIRAVVENLGEESAPGFEVEFFFEEEITKETGKIGEETVYGLTGGQELKPAVVWDTSNLSPGSYRIIVKADPSRHLSDYYCNNEIPRECDRDGDGEVEDEVEAPVRTILTEGKYIAFLEQLGLPRCPMGSEVVGQRLYQQKVLNLGTSPIKKDSIGLACSYRAKGKEGSTVMEEACKILVLVPTQLNPTDEGTLSIGIRYQFEFPDIEALGQGREIQWRLIATDPDNNDWAVSRAMILPNRKDYLTVYSKVDLWTFPERSGCGEPQPKPGKRVDVAPTIADARVFHVTTGGGESELYALTTTAGIGRWKEPYVAQEAGLTPPEVGRDTDGNTVIYLGSSGGYIYAIRDEPIDEPEGQFKHQPIEIWKFDQIEDFGQIDAVRYKPAVVIGDGGETEVIYFGTDNGLLAMNPDGSEKWFVKDRGAVTQPPLVDGTGGVWFAVGRNVYRYKQKNGSKEGTEECRYRAESSISTALSPNDNGTEIYFGTIEGRLHVLDSICSRVIEPVQVSIYSISGLAVIGQDIEDTVVYATTDFGDVLRLDYARGDDTFERTGSYRIGSISTAPAVLIEKPDDGNDILAVFITSEDGELKGLSPELDKLIELELWGTPVGFKFDTVGAMTSPVLDLVGRNLLVGSADGFLYAFDLSSIK